MVSTDQRLAELQVWLNQQFNTPINLQPASSDASARRYFRFNALGISYIVMDAPPPQEDCRPFVAIAERLARVGVPVPTIISQDLVRGFLLLSDLGYSTYLQSLTLDNADTLFTAAISALLTMQHSVNTVELPNYDGAMLQRELQLFPDWYLYYHRQPDSDLSLLLSELNNVLIEEIILQPQTFVHRDYMPRNLMADRVFNGETMPGVLDFQDAVKGPISYDIACLFKDAFISWPKQKVIQWQQFYWLQARERGLEVPTHFDDFHWQITVMGVQRHLKVLGIFARICYRDNKPKYIADEARFLGYLQEAVADYPKKLSLLQQLLQRLNSESV